MHRTTIMIQCYKIFILFFKTYMPIIPTTYSYLPNIYDFVSDDFGIAIIDGGGFLGDNYKVIDNTYSSVVVHVMIKMKAG